MVVVINNGPISGTCYQQIQSRTLLTAAGACHPFNGVPPAFSNSPTTLCCFQCCRPLTVHFGVGLLGSSPYRQQQQPTPNNASASYFACVPCGRWFDNVSRPNNWLGPSLLYWSNQLLLR